MTTFKELPAQENLHEFIKAAFNIELPLLGDWGYTQARATIITKLHENMPMNQLEHTFATIRAQLEMSMNQEANNSYRGINVNEKTRETMKEKDKLFEKVTYEVTGMREEDYNAFVQEYKDGYDNNTLDLNDHFKRRKEATLVREVVHFFEVSQTNSQKGS
jgi:hypothetical protein